MSGEEWCFPVTCLLTPQHCLCEQVTFVNGQAVFTLQSIKLGSALHEKMIDDLKSVLSAHKTLGDIKEDLSLLPKGESAGLLQPLFVRGIACNKAERQSRACGMSVHEVYENVGN